MDYVYILREALIWIITIFWLYQILVSVCSLVKLKDKPYLTNKNHKFMAIIPAHNEEAVVANLIESLKNQTYDKNLYDIYVIADNCTDNTAKYAKENPDKKIIKLEQNYRCTGNILKAANAVIKNNENKRKKDKNNIKNNNNISICIFYNIIYNNIFQ